MGIQARPLDVNGMGGSGITNCQCADCAGARHWGLHAAAHHAVPHGAAAAGGSGSARNRAARRKRQRPGARRLVHRPGPRPRPPPAPRRVVHACPGRLGTGPRTSTANACCFSRRQEERGFRISAGRGAPRMGFHRSPRPFCTSLLEQRAACSGPRRRFPSVGSLCWAPQLWGAADSCVSVRCPYFWDQALPICNSTL